MNIEERDQLEIRKLKLEINNIKKPLIYRLSFYGALAPIIVSIVAITLSISGGLFEKNSKILELRKENLQFQINDFEIQKQALIREHSSLKLENDSLIFNIKKVKDNYSGIEQELKTIKRNFEKLKNDKALLSKEIIALESLIYEKDFDAVKVQKAVDNIVRILEKNLGDFNNDFSSDFK